MELDVFSEALGQLCEVDPSALADPESIVGLYRDLARLEFLAAGEGLCIYGPVGVGKTHVAVALAHQACRRGYDALFVTASRMLADLAGGHADRSFAARLKALAKPALLAVDDFAMRDFSVSAADDFYELVCEIVGKPGHSLVLTSNRSPADWYPLFPNAVVGESVLDRVINSSYHLLMDGQSYRPNRRPGRNPKPER